MKQVIQIVILLFGLLAGVFAQDKGFGNFGPVDIGLDGPVTRVSLVAPVMDDFPIKNLVGEPNMLSMAFTKAGKGAAVSGNILLLPLAIVPGLLFGGDWADYFFSAYLLGIATANLKLHVPIIPFYGQYLAADKARLPFCLGLVVGENTDFFLIGHPEKALYTETMAGLTVRLTKYFRVNVTYNIPWTAIYDHTGKAYLNIGVYTGVM